MRHTSKKLRKLNALLSETAGLYHKLNVELGLSDSVSDILYQLHDNGGAYPISGLCTELGLPKQTVNSALRGLEKDGLLSLKRYSGRSKQAVLTDQGRAFCRDTVARVFMVEDQVLEDFTPAEIDTFVALHEKYNEALEKRIGGQGR